MQYAADRWLHIKNWPYGRPIRYLCSRSWCRLILEKIPRTGVAVGFCRGQWPFAVGSATVRCRSGKPGAVRTSLESAGDAAKWNPPGTRPHLSRGVFWLVTAQRGARRRIHGVYKIATVRAGQKGRSGVGMAERLELVRECLAADPMRTRGTVIALRTIHRLTA